MRGPSRSISTSLLYLSVLLLWPMILPAQPRLDPEAIGQGRASVATARGLSSLSSNIGALALDPLGLRAEKKRPFIEVDLTALPIGASAGSTYLDPDDFDFVFASKDLGEFTDEDRLRMAKLLAPDRLSADVAMNIVALRARIAGTYAIGFEYGHQVRARMNFPENFRTSVIGSGDVFQRDQVFSDPEMGGEWIRRMRLTLGGAFERTLPDTLHSHWLPAIGIAMALDRLEGIAHFDVDPRSVAYSEVISSPGERPRSIHVTGSYVFRSSTPTDTSFKPADAVLKLGSGSIDPAAYGWGAGFGLSVVILRHVNREQELVQGDPLSPQQLRYEKIITRDAIHFGLSLDNAGYLLWEGNNVRRSRPRIDTVLSDERGGITNEVLDKFQGDLDTIGPFTTLQPAQARMGVAADITAFVPNIPGDLIGSLEAAFSLNNAIGHEPARLSLGAAWTPKAWLTLRSGMQLGGRAGGALAFGMGFRPWSWLSIELATSDIISTFDSDREMIDAAVRVGGHVRW